MAQEQILFPETLHPCQTALCQFCHICAYSEFFCYIPLPKICQCFQSKTLKLKWNKTDFVSCLSNLFKLRFWLLNSQVMWLCMWNIPFCCFDFLITKGLNKTTHKKMKVYCSSLTSGSAEVSVLGQTWIHACATWLQTDIVYFALQLLCMVFEWAVW